MGARNKPKHKKWCKWDQCRLLWENETYGSKRCRQTAYRFRKQARIAISANATDPLATDANKPLKLAYADPPYPGKARIYRDQPSFKGEVDHRVLIQQMSRNYDGWALSTSAAALADILRICPRGARVCAWVKPIGASPRTYGLHNCWEPLIIVGGRQRRPGKRDWFAAQPARRHGDLIGRKPIAFAAFLFAALGAAPGDTLDDLFPGTGMIGRAWGEFIEGVKKVKEVIP